MNRAALLNLVRSGSFTKATQSKIDQADDPSLSRVLFVRPDSGYRLTSFGLKCFRQIAKSVTIEMEKGKCLSSRHILFLNRNSTMPYFCSEKEFIFFDLLIAAKMQLAGGDCDILMTMEGE